MGIVARHIGHGAHTEQILLGLGVNQAVNGNGRVAQVDLRQLIHAMAALWLDEAVRQHAVEKRPCHGNAGLMQHGQIELQIVANLLHACRQENRGHALQPAAALDFILGEDHHKTLTRLPTQGQGHDARIAGIEVRGFQIEAKGLALAPGLQQAFECGFIGNEAVVMGRIVEGACLCGSRGEEILAA